MGRKRVITEDQVLDAAQQVVVREGAGHLTIEAVAFQAGISKASVLYLYKSKKGLMKAVVDRMVRGDEAINEAAIASLGSVNGAAIRGRILASSQGLTDEFRPVALNLCASVANEPQLRRTGKDYMKRTVERIRETCDHPKGAMLAFLALEGVKLLELVDWHTWTESERKLLLKDIESLIDTDPQERGVLTPSTLRRPTSGSAHRPQAKLRKSSEETANAIGPSQPRKDKPRASKSAGKRKG